MAESRSASEAHSGLERRETVAMPYEYSLIGEYARMVLLLAAVPLLLCFVQLASQQQLSTVSIVSALVLLWTLLTDKGAAWFRSLVVVAMTIIVLVAVINPEDMFMGRDANPLKIPRMILLVCLWAASFFEFGAMVRASSSRTRWKALDWSLLGVPALVYAAGIPV